MTKEENEARLEKLKAIVRALPDKPGSYQFYDAEGTIIYVGKAKSLKNRVSSYFHSEVDRFKTKVLVSKIWDISYTIVNTEEDALLLENALIKKYNPRYNVLLKDGKTYPSICITKEYLPRIFPTRTINKKKGYLLWSLFTCRLHACNARTHQENLSSSYVQTTTAERGNRRGKIPTLSGISH